MRLFQSSQYLSLAAWNRSVWTARIPSYLHFKSEGSCQVRVLLLKMHEQSVQERLSGQRSAACLKNSWKKGFFYCPLTCRYGEGKTVACMVSAIFDLFTKARRHFIYFISYAASDLFTVPLSRLFSSKLRHQGQGERSPFTYNLCVGQASIFIIRHGPEGKSEFCPAFTLDGNFQQQLCKTSACWVQIKKKRATVVLPYHVRVQVLSVKPWMRCATLVFGVCAGRNCSNMNICWRFVSSFLCLSPFLSFSLIILLPFTCD